MALDGITAQLLSDELNGALGSGRIDKIFQPDRSTFLFHIRTESGIKKLMICLDASNPRMTISEQTRENPQMPPSFCMLLRKYLSGSKIVSVINPGYERVIEITATMTDELHDTKTLRLIAELMGRYSNLILVNDGGKIIDCAIHVDFSVNRIREVMPARIYEYPPKQEKMLPEKALELIRSGSLPIFDEEMHRPVDKALLNSVMGFSPLLARQIAFAANIDDRLPVSSLSDSDRRSLLDSSRDYLEAIVNRSLFPAVWYSEDGSPSEFYPLPLRGYHHYQRTSTICEAIDLYFKGKEKNYDLETKRHNLLAVIGSALSHAVRKTSIHKSDIEEGSKADLWRKYGDLLLSCTYMTPEDPSVINCLDYYSDPQVNIDIPLDPSKNISDNAQEYYKRFRKAKRKTELSEKYLKEDNEAVEYLRTLKAAAMAASCSEDIEAIRQELTLLAFGKNTAPSLRTSSDKKEKTPVINPNTTVGKAKSGKASSRALREAARKASMAKGKKQHNVKALPVRSFTTKDGYTVLCGRNNIQNDELTFKTASRNDWWFHIKGLPGTHVILKTRAGEDMPSDEAVLFAAETAAFYSRSVILEEHSASSGSRAGSIKAEIDYCPVSHVKKIPGARPGMVIYEGYYSIVVTAKDPEKEIG
ncbi:MAG: NFACT family protein [Clostridiales bacterium]|nr:NFACT family protein [Clostridiales bacterium]